MWIVKGLSLGLGIFMLGLVIYVPAVMHEITKGTPIGPGESVGVDVLSLYHNSQPWIFIAFVATLALGLSLVACWPHRIV
jgi:hypothetical protein